MLEQWKRQIRSKLNQTCPLHPGSDIRHLLDYLSLAWNLGTLEPWSFKAQSVGLEFGLFCVRRGWVLKANLRSSETLGLVEYVDDVGKISLFAHSTRPKVVPSL
ncbi:hypothetical protein VNO78_27072 [Psophocarpus tetragonolobus]|uniref:Uncharacterized protein n=1 Tax=Psophocarpus tetragonolobus TaxID=3891 RepID=A0AAN9S0P9_PSOTE